MQVMRPLPLIGVGLALVILDFRTEALDFLPDALGWGLAALAVFGLVIVVAVQERDRAWAIPAGVSGASGASPWQRLADARGTGRGDGPGGRAGQRNGRDADGTGKDE